MCSIFCVKVGIIRIWLVSVSDQELLRGWKAPSQVKLRSFNLLITGLASM